MRYIAAYMLSQLGGTNRPSEEDIKSILSSVGIECEKERVKMLLDSMHGKNVHDLIIAGKEKMSTVAVCAAPAAGPAVAQAPAAAAAPAAAKVEEKKEESEESDDDMALNLFD